MFSIGSISSDSLFYKELFDKEHIYISSMNINVIPQNEISETPWEKDMHDIGLLLLKLLSQSCSISQPEETFQNSLDIFLYI